ncbi:MAG: serine hydrolase [Verrucomicrobiales bacterium]|nr:serine hydrolase [Verrucomicrobiales bacterium]
MIPPRTTLCCLVLVSSLSFSSELEDKAEKHHEELQSKNEGVVFGKITGNEIEFGYAGTLGKGRQPIDEHSLFEIGSITKTFTGILLADQVLLGNARLDDPITQFLPDSVTENSSALSFITLLDLATHTSGLPRLPSNLEEGADQRNPYAHYSVESLYDYLSDFSPDDSEQKGTQSYSNLGMGLLGHLLELISGKSYDSLLKETILDPLGMNETFYQWNDPAYPPNQQSFRSIPSEARERLATGHRSGIRVPHWEFDALGGAGAIVSSANDILRYASAFWSPETATPLKKAMELATENHTPSMGLGWFVQEGKFSHDGGTGGFASSLKINPTEKTATIRLENSSAPTVVESATGDFTSIIGYWSGTLEAGAVKLRQVLRISDDGKASLHSIDQSAFGTPAAQTRFQNGKLLCVFPSIGGRFTATHRDETLKGEWAQSSDHPLTLTYFKDAPEPLLQALAKVSTGDFEPLEGYWSGYLGGKSGLFVVLKIHKIGNTADVALFSPDQSSAPLPVTKVSFEAGKFDFESTPLNATYEAKLKGKKLSGTWNQGAPMPLELDWSKEKPSRK